MRKMILLLLLLSSTICAIAQIEIGEVTSANGSDGNGNALCNGTIEVIAEGEAGPFTITLSDGRPPAEGVNGTYLFEDVCPGQYTILVEFEGYDGCIKELEATVMQDCSDAMVEIVSVEDKIPCEAITGSVVINATGADAPYNVRIIAYNPRPGSLPVVSSYNGLEGERRFPVPTSGDYYAEVSSQNDPACMVNLDFTVEVICDDDFFQENDFASINPSGCEESDGTITVFQRANGDNSFCEDSAPYDISWDNREGTSGSALVSETGYQIENLPIGTYIITAVDANGCTDEYEVDLYDEDTPEIVGVGILDECEDECNGELSILVSNETISSSFTFEVTLVDFINSDAVDDFQCTMTPGNTITVSNGGDYVEIPDLAAGNYSVNIIDNDTGCSTEETFTINEIPSQGPFQLDKDIPYYSFNSCPFQPTGSATFRIGGGTPPYQIVLNVEGDQLTVISDDTPAGDDPSDPTTYYKEVTFDSLLPTFFKRHRDVVE